MSETMPPLPPAEGQPLDFEARCAGLRNLPEAARYTNLTTLFFQTLGAERRPSIAQMFELAYGEASGAEYWSTYFAAPMPVEELAYMLATHRASTQASQRLLRIGVTEAIREGILAGEIEVRGAPTVAALRLPRPPINEALAEINRRHREYYGQSPPPDTSWARDVRLRLADVVRWLEQPKWRHFLPDGMLARPPAMIAESAVASLPLSLPNTRISARKPHDRDAAYLERLEKFKAEHGRFPTQLEDET